jgi:cytochrome c oxidase subunit 4
MSDSTELVTREDAGLPAAGAIDELAHVGDPYPVEEHSHPGPRQYVLIAVVLVILTGVEVAASYLDGHINSNLLVIILASMAAIKFFLVAAWYMHMKMDAALFRRMFTGGIILAVFVYGVVMLFFASTVLQS